MFRSSYSILSSFLIDLRKKSWRDLLSQGWLLLKKSRVQQAIVLLILTLLFSLILYMRLHKGSISEDFSVVPVVKKSFMVEVKTMGELDAAHSTTIASSVRGDRGKIIHLIPDGVTVGAGELLMKLDPTPFEEKLASLKSQLREQESLSAALKKAVEWEVSQAERDNKTAVFEIESAELELSKVLHGDGPLEIARLKAAMQKTFIKYDEINKYSEDLIALEKEGFLNPSELKNAQKKLTEEEDAYLSAKLQHDSYVNYVFPMLIKKAETLLKQTQIKHEESQKVRGHSIGKAIVELQQTDFSLETLQADLSEDKIKSEALFAIHPGGPKIIDQIKEILALKEHQIEYSTEVLKSFGNMSSATLPHIWEKMLNDRKVMNGSYIVSMAFGPGLTICGTLFEVKGK